ncbi:SH3 domain-containing protein [Stomatobaculum sp. F0698]|uniref:SH3 domain-containing protein n=1 Tax=Stomatobaculum sp. F0698 TaxID=3059030 RepID=UPI00272B3432|nr:SH3 domain-containing protein [Stomatobaculum sp. F0698]WLD87338.1 SH3 domain-containing protein [Stomatobaculum sp. F0698]
MAAGTGKKYLVILASALIVSGGIVAGALIATRRPAVRTETLAEREESREETREENRAAESEASGERDGNYTASVAADVANLASAVTEAEAALTAQASVAATEPATTAAVVASSAPVTTAPVTTAANYSQTMFVSNCAESISLRESPSTQARALRQIPFGAPVTVLGSAENGFYQVIYNGVTGYSLASYLVSYRPSESERLERPAGSTVSSNTSGGYRTMYCVNCREYITLRSIPSTSGADLAHIPLGASVSYVGTAENGFYEVIYNGRRGYALAQYLSY